MASNKPRYLFSDRSNRKPSAAETPPVVAEELLDQFLSFEQPARPWKRFVDEQQLEMHEAMEDEAIEKSNVLAADRIEENSTENAATYVVAQTSTISSPAIHGKQPRGALRANDQHCCWRIQTPNTSKCFAERRRGRLVRIPQDFCQSTDRKQ
jgi:hypothetical protein